MCLLVLQQLPSPTCYYNALTNQRGYAWLLPCYSRERNPDLATRPTRIADRELNCSQRRERDVEFPKQKKRSEIIKKQKAGKTVSCPVTNRDPVGHFIKRRLRIRFGAGCCASSFNPPASLKQERKRRKFGKCNIQHTLAGSQVHHPFPTGSCCKLMRWYDAHPASTEPSRASSGLIRRLTVAKKDGRREIARVLACGWDERR